MKRKAHVGRWRSASAERKFRAMEDELWVEVGGTVPDALDVATSFGPTRAYRWRGSGTPIVFLHGVSGTSLFWAPFAAVLPDNDVYAIDIMGDVGRSEQRIPFRSSVDLAAWLDETLAALGIASAHLVGHSLGGFVSLNAAVHRPARVESLVVFDPVGLAPLQIVKFLLWGLPILFGSLLPRPGRRWIGRRFRMPMLEDRRIMRMALHGNIHHPPRFPPLLPFNDEELRSIAVPVVVVVAEKSEMLDPVVSIERSRLIPSVDAHTVANAGHALTVSHFDDCCAYLLRVAESG